MNTTDINILKGLSTVVNRGELNEDLYNFLLRRWDLDKVNLEEEYIKIQTKSSFLSKSKREAIPEFIRIRSLLDEIKNRQENQESQITMESQGDSSVELFGTEI